MQDQAKQNVELINSLKVRLFDLQETIQSEREFHSKVFSHLADLLGIEEEKRSDVQVYFAAIEALQAKDAPQFEEVE